MWFLILACVFVEDLFNNMALQAEARRMRSSLPSESRLKALSSEHQLWMPVGGRSLTGYGRTRRNLRMSKGDLEASRARSCRARPANVNIILFLWEATLMVTSQGATQSD